MGDFSVLNDIPKMYQHCKATEDKDMTPFDFITDHLINIDCLFDKHENGDSQKPHAPYQYHHQSLFNYYPSQEYLTSLSQKIKITSVTPIYKESIYCYNYYTYLLRPPIS